jgi:hypothetical protein
MPTITIGPHDCISSVARHHGFHWRDLWEHADNAELRERRADPNLLQPGDVLFVPTPQARSERLDTCRKHRLVVRNRVAVLRIDLRYDGEAVTGPYVLEIAGRRIDGELSGEGRLEETIPAGVMRARLTLVERNEQIDLLLGDLDPADTPRGAIERLVNLGLFSDRAVQELTAEVRWVLRMLQRAEGLEVTGELDPDTADALVRRHGC